MRWRWPFLAASVLAHAALLAGLWAAGPYEVRRQQARQDSRLVQASLEKAQRMQLQRRLKALQSLQRPPGAGPAGDADARSEPQEAPRDTEALLAQARTLTERLETAERRARAEEMARLLKLTPAEAQKKLAKEEPPPPPLAGDAAQQMAQLEHRAQRAAAAAAARAERAQQGAAAQADQSRGGRGGGSSSPTGAGGNDGAAAGGGGGGGSGRPGTVPLEGGGGFSDPRRYAAASAVDLAATRGRVVGGQTLGPGGVATARLVLQRWYIAGPFASRGPADLHRVYPPELGVDLDAVYQGKDGRSLRWVYVDEPRYPLVPQPRMENAVYYAYTELRVDRAQDVWVDIGADDDSKLWLNDQLVWTSGSGDKPWYRQPFYTLDQALAQAALVEGSRRVRLLPGTNRLLFKLYNGIDLMFFSVVLRP